MVVSEGAAKSHRGINQTLDANLEHVQQVGALYHPVGRGVANNWGKQWVSPREGVGLTMGTCIL